MAAYLQNVQRCACIATHKHHHLALLNLCNKIIKYIYFQLGFLQTTSTLGRGLPLRSDLDS